MTSELESLRARNAELAAAMLVLQAQLRASGVAGEAGQQAVRSSDDLKLANERIILAGLRAQEDTATAEREFAQLNALLAGLAEGVLIGGADGRTLLVNDAARRIFGLPDGAWPAPARNTQFRLQRLDGTALPIEDWPQSRVLRDDHFVGEELIVLVAGDQPPRRVSFSGNAVIDQGGKAAITIVTCRDVTELRRLEQVRQDFIALVSHDLRSPLTVVLGQAQRLVRRFTRAEDNEGASSASAIVTSAQRMNGMIGQLLDSSYLESGAFKLVKTPTDLLPQITDVVGMIDESDRARVSIDSADVAPIDVDAELFRRVVGNLITNALKYSPPETPVTVRVRTAPEDVIVSVTNEGDGIPVEDQGHLFNRFYRSNASVTAGRTGYGLGLYIARLVMEAHGGRVWFVTAVGKGSTFSMAFPRVGDSPSA